MCIFCKIINNEIPSYKVYEDEEIIAILDISQLTYGHTLIMPKKHYDNFWQADPQTISKIMNKANEVSQLICQKLNSKGCNIFTNTNEVAGQTVLHWHVHILPRYENDDFKINEISHDYNKEEILKKIKGE
ncbi:MAG: HIT domain-containing protein [Erysipelotrichaceae bacterium]